MKKCNSIATIIGLISVLVSGCGGSSDPSLPGPGCPTTSTLITSTSTSTTTTTTLCDPDDRSRDDECCDPDDRHDDDCD
jgi:hypothetical protein